MILSVQEIKNIAELSKIGITEEEAEKFREELEKKIDFVQVLKEVDVEHVDPTFQVTGLLNVTEEDVVRSDEQAASKELLDCTPLKVEARQILVKKVL